MHKHSLAALACALLAGCNATTMPQANLPTGQKAADTATIVMGLDSPLASNWHLWNYSDADHTVNEKPDDEDTFPVSKLPPHHGLVAVQVMATSAVTRFGPDGFTDKGAAFFQYCAGKKLPSISVKAGEVVYVGDINVWFTSNGDLGLNYAHDFAKAQQYVEKNYPALAPKLEDRPFQMYLISSAVCT